MIVFVNINSPGVEGGYSWENSSNRAICGHFELIIYATLIINPGWRSMYQLLNNTYITRGTSEALYQPTLL